MVTQNISSLTEWVYRLTNRYLNVFPVNLSFPDLPFFYQKALERLTPFSEIFSNSIKCIEKQKKPHKLIALIHQELNEFLSTPDKEYIKCKLQFSERPLFEVEALHSNLSGINHFLEEMVSCLQKHSDLFTAVIMNGSLGTNDFKPGWSDVDLFCMINTETLLDEQKLRNAKQTISSVNKIIYKYNILQLHKVFLSFETLLAEHRTQYLPEICVKKGKLVIVNADSVTAHVPNNKKNSIEYFKKDIFHNSFKLLSKELILHEKVLLFHRVFSFPFAFLQIFGNKIYKKDSFNIIANKFEDIFPGISEFYADINSFYHTWQVNSLKTIDFRDTYLDHYPPPVANKKLVRGEKEICNKINEEYKKFISTKIDTYTQYLKQAKNHLQQKEFWAVD